MGIGVDISNLAPSESKVNNAAKKSTGAVSFMNLYSHVTGLIGQHNRRGALIITINDTHPDLLEFIGIKQNTEKVTKANISIRISDKFMEAVKNDDEWKLSFTRPETNETVEKEVNARKILRLISESNFDWGEPGFLFWDRINTWSLLSEDENFEFAGVNP